MKSARNIPVGDEVVDNGDFDGVTPISEDGRSWPSQLVFSSEAPDHKIAYQESCLQRSVLVNVSGSWHVTNNKTYH
jgi:hypothetical protein